MSDQRHALISGATGFIGSALTRRLLAEDWKVTAVVRDSTDTGTLPSGCGSIGSEIGPLTRFLTEEPVDIVIHLASLFLAQHRPEDLKPLILTNVLLGTELAEAAAAAGVTRFVNTGTAWQHFETEAYRAVNLYAATKQAFEDVLDYYCDAHDIRALTLKLCDTYGPDDTRSKVVSLLLDAANSEEPLAMSPGQQALDLVHIEDVVDAFVVAIDRTSDLDTGVHERFAVTSSNPISLRELADCVESVAQKAIAIEWGGRDYRPREVMRPWSGKVLPGWTPKVPLAQGIASLLKT